MPQNMLSATCAVCDGSAASPWSTSTIVSDAAYRSATEPTPSNTSRTSTSSTSWLHEQRRNPDAENRGDSDGKIGDAVDERVRRRLVDERVKRREAEEDEGEHQRSLLSGAPRHPREDDGLGRPAGHESRPVERECERDAGEPDADRDEQRGDLGAHPLAEAEAAEDDVRDGDSEHPRGRSLGRSAVVDESPAERRRKRCVQQEHRRGGDTQGRDRERGARTRSPRRRRDTSRARASRAGGGDRLGPTTRTRAAAR